MTEPEYLESLLAPLRASFHAKRRERIGIAEQIARSLDLYIKAVDVSVTRELCQAHGLPAPSGGDPPSTIAAELLRLTQLLPELRSAQPAATDRLAKDRPSPEVEPADGRDRDRSKSRSVESPSDKRPRRPNAEASAAPRSEPQWGSLLAAMTKTPLVIVGGPPHLERLNALPAHCLEHVEWIDTTRQGTHAIGNLERRIRDRRIGGIIILEGLVQHRHSDPLLSAARGVALAHAFGGKGGKAAMLQALDEVESRIVHQQAAEPRQK